MSLSYRIIELINTKSLEKVPSLSSFKRGTNWQNSRQGKHELSFVAREYGQLKSCKRVCKCKLC
jgi:hypothetical protein